MRYSRKNLRPLLFLLIVFCFFSKPIEAETSAGQINSNPVNAAVISGKARNAGGEPAFAGVSIGLFKAVADWNAKPLMKTKASANGEFIFKNVPPGAYFLYPEAPAFVLEGGKYYTTSSREGIPVVITEGGEKIENIEITMTRGAVITGRLTDPEGKPVISERIWIQTFNDKGEKVYARKPQNRLKKILETKE